MEQQTCSSYLEGDCRACRNQEVELPYNKYNLFLSVVEVSTKFHNRMVTDIWKLDVPLEYLLLLVLPIVSVKRYTQQP